MSESAGGAPAPARRSNLDFLAGGGEMDERMRALDWSKTALGPVERWPQSLRSPLSMLLPSKAQIILFWGPEFIVFYNDAYRPVFGGKHPQMLGQPGRVAWGEIWDTGANLHALLDGVVRTGEAFHACDMLFVIERYDFVEETYFDVSYDPVRDESGGVGGVFCIVTETTGRVVGERRLALLRDLAERTAAARTARDVCVLAMETLAGKPDVPFAMAFIDGKLQAATPGAEATHATVPFRDVRELAIPGGKLVLGINPRRSFDAQYASFIELVAGQVASAITNARAYEEERRRSEALAAIDRAKTTFFSNVSHEFRTPLTLVLGTVEEAASDPETPDRVRRQLDLAHRNALRLLKLVNTLLDFSRIEAGRMAASFEPVDLAAITTDLASTFRSAIEGAGLRFRVNAETLDEPVYVDRAMWEKIVLNLLSNAFKYTLRGAVTVNVHRDAGSAVLEVIDTGVGIPEHELPRIFERFYRVHGVSGRTQEGTGIGLSLVHELVKLHAGSIMTASTLGEGTCFSVRVPFGTAHLPPENIQAARGERSTAIRADAFVQEALRWLPDDTRDEAAQSASIDETGQNEPAHPGRPDVPRILLVDDNADMREYVRSLLAPSYTVETAADGEQALDAIRRRRPALVLTDIMMPGIDGLALVRTLRADAELRSLPVILLSARAGEEARVEGLDMGADDYLVKPFASRELMAKVATLLNLTRMRRESEERFQVYVRATSDVVYRMSRDWSEMRYLHGRNFVADTEGPTRFWLEKYIAPEDQPHIVAVVRKAIDAKTTFELEHRVRRVDGTLGWAHSRAIPILDDRGEITEWFGTAVDVTARKRTEQRQAEARRSLEAADRHKDEFLAMLAHELRNPLAPIAMASELLTRKVTDDAPVTSAIAVIKRQTAQLTRLVDDLLDVSRIRQGRIDLRREAVDLAKIVAQAVETVEPQMREKKHQVSVTTSARERLRVDGDPARLVQCVVNVLSNAAKYTDPGGRIAIRMRRDGSHAVIEVTDTGAGIAADLLPHVFDLFTQSERTLDRAQGGLGIGLSVVKRLVEMHSGSVVAHSAGVGGGSTFEIRLPQVSVVEAIGPATAAAEITPRRVLVVDDNVDAANSLGELLAMQGHRSEVAYSAAGAIQRAGAFQPEIALLDLALPEMSGLELARQLRAMPRLDGIRLVALTGYGQAEMRERTQAAQFDDHLVKPVDVAAIERTLARVFSESAAANERSV